MDTYIRFSEKLINFIGYLCGCLMVLMLLNVFYDVVMRYLFDIVAIGMQELEWHLFATMFMFGIGYTLKEDGHVRVDIFYENFSAPVKASINILGALIFTLPFCYLIITGGFDYAHEAYVMNEGSGDPGGLPHRWIIRSVIPLSSVFLLFCALHVVMVQLRALVFREGNDSKGANK
ncbi:MAG: TRAP transporter small permease subunit [Exilibacterium sp.]